VRRIMDEQHGRVRTMLSAQQTVLREAAALLLNKETMSGEELKAIVTQSVSQVGRGSVRRATVHSDY
jgi:ATP-dependent Zn protease